MSHYEIYKTICKLMYAASISRKHSIHVVDLATVRDNIYPQVRQVVLRYFDRNTRIISFHADIRSPKVIEMVHNENIQIMSYDPNSKVQLRFSAKAKIHHLDDVAKEAWDKTKKLGQRCYLTKYAPSTVLVNGFDEEDIKLRNSLPDADEAQRGFENFSVVRCYFYELDYVRLDVKGHQRFFFTFDNKGNVNCQTLNP